MEPQIYLLDLWSKEYRQFTLAEFLSRCECRPGWHQVITELCEKLWELGWDGRVKQCKEKFGLLRFYSDNCTDEMHRLIDHYQERSGEFCELCGAFPASLHMDRGWVSTRCDDCYSEELAKLARASKNYTI